MAPWPCRRSHGVDVQCVDRRAAGRGGLVRDACPLETLADQPEYFNLAVAQPFDGAFHMGPTFPSRAGRGVEEMVLVTPYHSGQAQPK
jgi:hypothetical protein